MFKSKFSIIAVSVTMSLFSATSFASTATNLSEAQTEIAAKSQEQVFQLMRQRWAEYFLGSKSLPMNERLTGVIKSTNDQAKKHLATITLDKRGLWDDLPLGTNGDAEKLALGSNLYSTYIRLNTLAKAYKLEGGELEGNTKLIQTIISALDLLNKEYYKSGAPEYGNWWHWELGSSRMVNTTLVILYDDLPRELIDNYIDASRYFVPKATHLSAGFGAPYSSNPYIWESTGGNRTDNAQVVLVRGLLAGDSDEVEAAINSLVDVVQTVETGEGFYEDGSYILHKDLPYSGTYGQVMLEGLGMMIGLLADTPYAQSATKLQSIYPLMMKTFAPILVDGKAMDFVNGRSVSRASAQNDVAGGSIISAMMLYLNGAPEEYKTELEAFIKGQLAKSGGLSSRILSNYQVAEQMLKSDTTAKMDNVSHFQFPDMDRVVHHRDNWSFGVAMHSDRIGNYECMNGENLKGWHTADGMTYLYNSQAHYKGYWASVDPYKHAGTTTLQRELEPCSGQVSTQRSGRNSAMTWTGGVSLGTYGVSGMDFTDATNSLSALKSWFMFDDEVVALGSDINNSTSYTALTTIENRKVDDGALVKVDGKPVSQHTGEMKHLSITYSKTENPIQYINLTDVPVKVETVCRTGLWEEIGSTHKGEEHACYVEATIDHANADSYAYVIIPDSEKTTSVPVEVLSNTDSVHAVNHTELGIFAANFWNSGQAGLVKANSAMSIMTKTEGDVITIAVSDPTRGWFDVDFELAGSYEIIQDREHLVQLSNGNKFSVDLGGKRGSGYEFVVKQVK